MSDHRVLRPLGRDRRRSFRRAGAHFYCKNTDCGASLERVPAWYITLPTPDGGYHGWMFCADCAPKVQELLAGPAKDLLEAASKDATA